MADTSQPNNDAGPLFICGRQYSGNTLMTLIVQRMPGCFALTNEGVFFEHRYRVDKIAGDAPRAEWVANNLKLKNAVLTKQTLAWLTAWVQQHPKADGLSLYREAMRFLTETTGNRFWAQKATSYVYYAREILTSIPDARMIYLMRNPFDICTSSMRRPYEVESIVGRTVGWNGGVRTIEQIASGFPGRIHIIKYEDLVTDPQPPIEALCTFLGVRFTSELLEVPHINPSENHFKVIEGSKGINASRLYYYMNLLSRSDIAAVQMLAAKDLLRKYYPTLPHNTQPLSTGARCVGLWLIFTGLLRYGIDRIRWARRMNSSFIRRTYRRLIALR